MWIMMVCMAWSKVADGGRCRCHANWLDVATLWLKKKMFAINSNEWWLLTTLYIWIIVYPRLCIHFISEDFGVIGERRHFVIVTISCWNNTLVLLLRCTLYSRVAVSSLSVSAYSGVPRRTSRNNHGPRGVEDIRGGCSEVFVSTEYIPGMH